VRRVLACVTTALVLGGCGNLGAGEETDRVEQLQLLSAEDVARYPQDSPARAFLEWWRALQFGSAVNAASHFDSALKLTPARLQRQLDAGPDILALRARPRVVDVLRRGDRATVYVVFTEAERNPNGRADKVRTPRSFEVLREDGVWKLADNRYLTRALRAAKAFFEGGEEKQRSGSGSGR
jgi:hypothetical protein